MFLTRSWWQPKQQSREHTWNGKPRNRVGSQGCWGHKCLRVGPSTLKKLQGCGVGRWSEEQTKPVSPYHYRKHKISSGKFGTHCWPSPLPFQMQTMEAKGPWDSTKLQLGLKDHKENLPCNFGPCPKSGLHGLPLVLFPAGNKYSFPLTLWTRLLHNLLL